MKSNYNIILTLEIFHSFYRGGKCKHLIFSPSTKTIELFNRFGFIFKSFANGFNLLSKTENLADYLAYITKASGLNSFNFAINSSDNDFCLFTEFPLNEIGYYYYRSGSSNNKEHQQHVQLNPYFESAVTSDKLLEVQFDFDQLQASPLMYAIDLDARESRWYYYIIEKKQSTEGELQIDCKGENKVLFKSNGVITLPNGVNATQFSSNNKNLVSADYRRYQLDLLRTNTVANRVKTRVIYKGLPMPRPVNVGITDNSPKQTISTMYVYL